MGFNSNSEKDMIVMYQVLESRLLSVIQMFVGFHFCDTTLFLDAILGITPEN